MKTLIFSIFILAAVTPGFGQADVPIAMSGKVVLDGEIQDLAFFGGLKESTCDTTGNIFAPSNRKYGSAIRAVLQIPPDAKSYQQYSIDRLPQLGNGDIIDFAVEPTGEIYALARQVLKYSTTEVPETYGNTFIVHYANGGIVIRQLRLEMDTDHFRPTGLAILSGGDYLVVGFDRIGDKVRVLARTFRSNGTLKARLDLGHEGTKAANKKSVLSPRVIDPMAIRANGSIFVLRGTTNEPIYVLNESGHLMSTVHLKIAGLEFDSAHIFLNDLVVHAHEPITDESGRSKFLGGPERINFPVFDLRTGEPIRTYYWYEGAMGLVCYSPHKMTFMGQNSAKSQEWGIFFAVPNDPENRSVHSRLD